MALGAKVNLTGMNCLIKSKCVNKFRRLARRHGVLRVLLNLPWLLDILAAIFVAACVLTAVDMYTSYSFYPYTLILFIVPFVVLVMIRCINYRQNLDAHLHLVTEPTSVKIERCATQLPVALLHDLSRALSNAGVTKAYVFWMSIGDESPHMGLAIAPDDDGISQRAGQLVEPIWTKFSPKNTAFAILRLGSELDDTIVAYGEILVPWPTESKPTR